MAGKKMKFFSLILVVILIAFVGGCGLSGSKDKKNIGSEPVNPPVQNGQKGNDTSDPTPPVNPQPTQEEVELTLYFGDDQAMYLEPEKRSVAKDSKPLGELLVQELIKGPEQEGLNKTIPEGTRLLSLEIVDGVAFVNFSEEVKTKHWGGTAGETMTVQSLAVTLAQLPEVQKVQFLIDGKKEESIWGHGYTGEPIPPQQDLIAK